MAHLKIKTEKGLQYIGDKRIDDITIAGVLTTDGNGNLESKELDNNFQRPLDKFSGIVKQTLAEDNTNSFSAAEVGIDYQGPLNNVEGLIKSQGDKQIYLAEPEIDYCPATKIITLSNSSQNIELESYAYYNIIMPIDNGLTLTYLNTDNLLKISHGLIKFKGSCFLTLKNFVQVKGLDDINWDQTHTIGTYLITEAQLWEFSSLNGYLIIKNWSED